MSRQPGCCALQLSLCPPLRNTADQIQNVEGQHSEATYSVGCMIRDPGCLPGLEMQQQLMSFDLA